MKRKWLRAKDKELIKEMAKAGESLPYMALKLRHSQGSIIHHLRKLKIPVPPAPSKDHVTHQDVENAVFNYNNYDISYDASATALGITEVQMRNMVKNYLDEQYLKRILISSNGNGKFNLNDPRSAVCQKIQRCSHHQCHLHERCPAYENYLMRRN